MYATAQTRAFVARILTAMNITANLIGSGMVAKNVHHKTRRDQVLFFFSQGLLAVLLGVAGASSTAAPFQLPALVEPASQEHHVGKVIFVELVTPDLDAAKQFYARLFGWTFLDVRDGGTEYAQAAIDGHSIAGLVQRDVPVGQHRQSAWLNFIAVRDVDAARKIAVEHGARVLSEPHTVLNRGREAVFADPQGAVFAVLASSSGDPPDVLPAPGDWIWSSLITRDPDADAAFYQALFDYDVFELPADDGAQHLLLASDNYARASANTFPVHGAGSHPRWLSYVRVEDATRMTAKAVALGGRVLVEPRVDRHGGRVAVIADPLGAPIGLLEWADTQSKEVTP